MIHSDPMSTLSLCTSATISISESSIMEELEQYIYLLGWIWSAGEDQHGHWCELFTPEETKLFRECSLRKVLECAVQYIITHAKNEHIPHIVK